MASATNLRFGRADCEKYHDHSYNWKKTCLKSMKSILIITISLSQCITFVVPLAGGVCQCPGHEAQHGVCGEHVLPDGHRPQRLHLLPRVLQCRRHVV